MSIKKSLFVGVVALGLSPLVLANGYVPPAADSWEPGVYVGVEGGYGMTNWDSIEKVVMFVNRSITGIDDTDAFAARFYVGGEFNKHFSVEAGLSYFFNEPYGIVNGNEVKFHGNTWAIDLLGVIKANVVDNFGLFAKLGVSYLQSDEEIELFGEVHSINLAYGAGAYYDITKNVTMDISWLRYNGNQDLDKDYLPYADKFTIGVRYKFII